MNKDQFLYSDYSQKNQKKISSIVLDTTVEPYVTGADLPLILSARHSGYSFWPFIILRKITSQSFVIWHFLTVSLFIFLLITWLERLKGRISIEGYTTLLAPIVLFQFPFFISELLLPIVFIMILLLGELKEKKDYFLYGFLIGIGGLIRPNFLWFIPAILILKPIDFKKIKELLISFIAAIIGLLPYLIFLDFKILLSEASSYQSNFSWKSLGIELFALLTFDKTTVEIIHNDSYISNFLNNNFFYNFTIISYLLSVVMIFSLYKIKSTRKYIACIAGYVLLMLLTIKSELSYSNYLHGILFFVILFWNETLKYLKSTNYKFFVSIMVLLIINFSFGYYELINNTPVNWHNKTLTKEILSEVKDDKNIYTVGVTDVGKYEFLSNDQIYPIHLYRLVEQNKINSHYDVVRLTKNGTLIIPVNDEWSLWPKKFGQLDVINFIERAKRDRIKVDVKTINSNNRKAYVIRYSSSET